MSIKVITIPVGPLSANCHVVYSLDNDKALIVDPGGDFSLIMQRLNAINKKPGAVILTHGHFDHIMVAADFQAQNVPVYLHQADVCLVEGSGNLAKYFGIKMPPFNVDNRLIEGDLQVCGFNLRVIETPGHTEGSVCIQIENAIFTGDTLFFESYGRTDFPSGNAVKLIESAKKLFGLTGNYVLYTGHGESTTLDYERKHNAINFSF